MNCASVICVGATGKPVRATSFAHAAVGSGRDAARATDAPKLAAETPTNRDPRIDTGNCRRCDCFMSSLRGSGDLVSRRRCVLLPCKNVVCSRRMVERTDYEMEC